MVGCQYQVIVGMFDFGLEYVGGIGEYYVVVQVEMLLGFGYGWFIVDGGYVFFQQCIYQG